LISIEYLLFSQMPENKQAERGRLTRPKRGQQNDSLSLNRARCATPPSPACDHRGWWAAAPGTMEMDHQRRRIHCDALVRPFVLTLPDLQNHKLFTRQYSEETSLPPVQPPKCYQAPAVAPGLALVDDGISVDGPSPCPALGVLWRHSSCRSNYCAVDPHAVASSRPRGGWSTKDRHYHVRRRVARMIGTYNGVNTSSPTRDPVDDRISIASPRTAKRITLSVAWATTVQLRQSAGASAGLGVGRSPYVRDRRR